MFASLTRRGYLQFAFQLCRLLRLPFKLLLYSPQINARARQDRRYLSRETIRSLNWADVVLYDYFHRKLMERIRLFGRSRMNKLLDQLAIREKEWYDFCVQREYPRASGDGSAEVMFLMNKKPSNLSCFLMTESEMRITKFIRKRQRIKHPGSVT